MFFSRTHEFDAFALHAVSWETTVRQGYVSAGERDQATPPKVHVGPQPRIRLDPWRPCGVERPTCHPQVGLASMRRRKEVFSNEHGRDLAVDMRWPCLALPCRASTFTTTFCKTVSTWTPEQAHLPRRFLVFVCTLRRWSLSGVLCAGGGLVCDACVFELVLRGVAGFFGVCHGSVMLDRLGFLRRPSEPSNCGK